MSLWQILATDAIDDFEKEYQDVIKDRNRYLNALKEISDNHPETPAEYAKIASIARKALNGGD